MESNLSVITFNYDRSLEYFLFQSFKSAFGLTAKEAATILQSIPIIHVYGQLGAPDFIDPNGRPYSPDLDRTSIEKAVSGIEIVHESEDVPSPRAGAIHYALSNAEVVCFLGFGYHKPNVDRLGIRNFKGPDLLGSVYGLGKDEIRKAENLLRPFRMKHSGNPHSDILDFIRRHPVFE